MGWGGSKSDFRWTISEAYHPTLISGIVPNYPLNRPFGSISDCSLFSIERSVFTWRHSSRDWRVISPDIFDPIPPRDRASKKVTTGSRSSCMKHNSVLCPPLSLSALSPPVLEILFPRQHFQSVWLNEIRNDARDTVGKTHFWCSRRRISKKTVGRISTNENHGRPTFTKFVGHAYGARKPWRENIFENIPATGECYWSGVEVPWAK